MKFDTSNHINPMKGVVDTKLGIATIFEYQQKGSLLGYLQQNKLTFH